MVVLPQVEVLCLLVSQCSLLTQLRKHQKQHQSDIFSILLGKSGNREQPVEKEDLFSLSPVN